MDMREELPFGHQRQPLPMYFRLYEADKGGD